MIVNLEITHSVVKSERSYNQQIYHNMWLFFQSYMHTMHLLVFSFSHLLSKKLLEISLIVFVFVNSPSRMPMCPLSP